MLRTAFVTFVFILFSAAALADSLRSDKHLVKIDVQSLSADSRQYNVQVFDAESRNHVAHLKVAAKGGSAEEAETVAGGMTYKVRVVPYGEAYLVEFTAADGDGVTDSMRGGFTTAKAKPAPAPARPSQGGKDIKAPAVIKKVAPVYTEDARAAGAAGTVVLELLIDRSGFVRDATVLKPMGYGLSESAVDAAKQWQFEPSVKGRTPVEVLQEVTLEFQP